MKIQLRGEWETRRVWLDGRELSAGKSQAVVNHSPDGPNWSYSGSGPSQMALMILLEVADRATAVRNYQRFKFEVIAGLPAGDFEVELEVDRYISQ